MNRILIVEDDYEMNHLMCKFLRGCGFDVEGCINGEEAYDAMYNNTFDLIVSDVMMPRIDGFEFAQTVRKLNETIPILFVSARDDIASKQKGFKIGIDDYMVKPIDLDELEMRVYALLRRAHINTNRTLTMNQFEINANSNTVSYQGTEIPCTLREFNILYKLLSYPNKTFSRTQLMDEFWDVDTDTSPRAVDVYITKLRDKCSEITEFKIVTVHGLGYKVVLT
ncbi:two-component system response regulator [Erysipelothrix larvae]|uniref:Heme response regulator HssR n=1 Tax=Erysipelothrix larvae TaxID=1514105 RepID=A0A0X8H1W2_9FIRM|nr:response regulator transcription factor [Erysipelothrix larvae]AMC94552.1 two-component system response regulator [Erysipelothrix larvae]